MGRDTWETIHRALADRPPAHLPSGQRRAAVSLVLRDGPCGIEILFIHRAEHPNDPWSGHIAFPGGRVEDGEVPLATAIRETAEEVGLDLGKAELLGGLDEVQTSPATGVDLVISPFVFRTRDPSEAGVSREVRSVWWLALDDLLGERFASTFDHTVDGRILHLPCLRIDDRVIWGLTYRMVSDLAARVRAAMEPA